MAFTASAASARIDFDTNIRTDELDGTSCKNPPSSFSSETRLPLLVPTGGAGLSTGWITLKNRLRMGDNVVFDQ